MKAEVLDGSLQGRDILFNLADMNPEHMEFRLVMDVTNVDIGRLDDPDPRRKTRGAELSLNADITGRGLEILVEPGLDKELAWKGNINIHKIGEEFGNRLFKGLSQEKGKSKLGIFQFAYDNAVIPTGFNYSIDLGLMYTTVSFYRKTIGYAIGPEVKAEFDRIPIQEYLRKVREVE
jgi:hypothetical protein